MLNKMVGNIHPIAFLHEVRVEMKKVIWPSREEAIRLTGIVIGVSLIVALFVGGLDLIFTSLLSLII